MSSIEKGGEGTEVCPPNCSHCAFQASLTAAERLDLRLMNAALARFNEKFIRSQLEMDADLKRGIYADLWGLYQ